ncbi:THAP-type domain-containing protein, partial [Aphis craccivora]
LTSLNGTQNAELTKHALNLIKDTGVNVVSITFDGCSSNVTMARLLGCDFSIITLNTKFEDVVVFLDPAHMVKLIRNTFGEKKTFLDGDGNLIDFNFVQKLFILQETEGCHLANK